MCENLHLIQSTYYLHQRALAYICRRKIIPALCHSFITIFYSITILYKVRLKNKNLVSSTPIPLDNNYNNNKVYYQLNSYQNLKKWNVLKLMKWYFT